jgi:hypothetical protein
MTLGTFRCTKFPKRTGQITIAINIVSILPEAYFTYTIDALSGRTPDVGG